MSGQQGAITLLMTSMLLVMTLALSVTGYRQIYFQIKRSQNELISRQAFWIAEGGLECLYAQLQDAHSVPSPFSLCGLPSGLELILSPEGEGRYRAEAHYSHARISQSVRIDERDGTFEFIRIQGSWCDF